MALYSYNVIQYSYRSNYNYGYGYRKYTNYAVCAGYIEDKQSDMTLEMKITMPILSPETSIFPDDFKRLHWIMWVMYITAQEEAMQCS